MHPLAVVATAFGLALDAFAVAIACSIALCNVSARQTIRVALHFGLFQAAMPVVGWLLGLTVVQWISAWDHWLAAGLLSFIGGRAIYGAYGHECAEPRDCDPTRGLSLIVLSIATSIDALAVGLSFALLRIRIWYPSLIIGLVAAGMTTLGMLLGARLGARFGRRAEAVGGVVLIAIGLKILADHML